MSVCACGGIANDGRPACDRCSALALFGLSRAATQTEIKDGYRVLAKVWHPDRFQNDEPLQRKAEEKLKEINSAYQLLTTTKAHRPNSGPSGPAPAPEEPQRASATASTRVPYQRPPTPHSNASFGTNRQVSKKQLAVMLAILVAGGVSIYLWFSQRADHDADDSQTQTAANVAAPDGRGSQENKEKKPSQNQVANDSTVRAGKTAAHPRTKDAASGGASLVVYPDENPQVPYFTVGSTKADVIRIQGPPNKVAGNVFVYGLSEVHFQNGRVEFWRMDPNTPLKAKAPSE